ncbi:MAG: hypothetical protein EPO24_03995 [Bacteroidetes bacterium]|nr:MAG: hypothetical protein EPO24_03995 [Bacteroidota bacterium]
MKYFLWIMVSASLCFAQTYDTLKQDVGQPGGYQRLREFDDNGHVRKVWFTTWKEDGMTLKEYSEYDEQNKLLARVESTFNSGDKLIGLRHYVGDAIGKEELEFSPEGQVLKKFLSLHLDGNPVLFRKVYDGTWRYSALIDGAPPIATGIDETEFKAAEQLFSKQTRLTSERQSQSSSAQTESSPSVVAEFTGSNIRNTTPFTVSSPWEVKWDAKGEFFSIYLYDEEGKLINVLGNQTKSGEGSSYFPKSGKYYFSVNTVGDWSVKVVTSQ